MSSLEADIYMVISLAHDMQGLKLTGSRCYDFWVVDESGIGAGGRDGMGSCISGFH